MNAAPRIAIACITPSLTNPRKRFDEAQLAELTDSVKRHDVLQPILLRPNGKEGHYELVAGERRFRAAKAAGLVDIPATVRELSDTDVLEIQVVENLQREDLHELEEAEGYEKLLKCAHPNGDKYSIEEIAAKVGKSRSYVFARLKLLALCPEARKAFFAGELDASKALLIARIGHHDTQRQALKDVTKGEYDRGPMSYREAHQHILNNYMLKLSSAPFDTKHPGLVAKAGACGPCPKRTGNQVDLFGDVKSADVCTDPKCFDDKRQAHFRVAVADLEAKGKKVIYGEEAKKAFPRWDDEYSTDHLSDRYAAMTGHHYIGNRQLSTRDLLGDDYKPIMLQHPKTGKFLEVATRQAVEAAARAGGKAGAKKSAKAAKPKGPKPPDIDDVLTERLATLVHKNAPKQFSKTWYVSLAELLVKHLSTRDLEAVALAWGWKANAFRSGQYGDRKLPPEASKLGERDLILLMFDLVFAISAYTRGPVLKLFGIQEPRIREQIIEERKVAAKKAREEAKAKATKKTGLGRGMPPVQTPKITPLIKDQPIPIVTPLLKGKKAAKK
jgi:ParB/RepB/Spo0J family partition protein